MNKNICKKLQGFVLVLVKTLQIFKNLLIKSLNR
jgi:hypothetical protein